MVAGRAWERKFMTDLMIQASVAIPHEASEPPTGANAEIDMKASHIVRHTGESLPTFWSAAWPETTPPKSLGIGERIRELRDSNCLKIIRRS
jgi:hypothetical protein